MMRGLVGGEGFTACVARVGWVVAFGFFVSFFGFVLCESGHGAFVVMGILGMHGVGGDTTRFIHLTYISGRLMR